MMRKSKALSVLLTLALLLGNNAPLVAMAAELASTTGDTAIDASPKVSTDSAAVGMGSAQSFVVYKIAVVPEESTLQPTDNRQLDCSLSDNFRTEEETEPALESAALIIASGTWGTCPWEITSDGELRVYPGIGENHTYGDQDEWYEYGNVIPWHAYANRIKSIPTLPATSGKVILPATSRGLFADCSSLTDISGLTNWDTSNVVDMSYMFYACDKLENISALSKWETSNVRYMNDMFGPSNISNLSALSSWKTGNVIDMSGMLSACKMTNLSALANWDTSSVATMSNMFDGCLALTDISALANWNTSSVADMSGMFGMCTALSNLSPLATWNTSHVTNMRSMFLLTSVTNLDALSAWNTGRVTCMKQMFMDCSSLVRLSGIQNWQTTAVTDMSDMFYRCNSLTDASALSGWNTVRVTSMDNMFYKCTSLTSLSVGRNTTVVKEIPAYEVNGHTDWWSTADKQWYTAEQIASSRVGVADTYTKGSNISSAEISVVPDQTHTGKAITPKPTVKLGSITLKEGTDYTLSYKNNTNVGTATITITGKGNFTGTKSVTFKIVEKAKEDISKANVSSIANQTYTGKAITPKPTVKMGNTTLKEGTDYTLSYKNNTNVGTATITISGKGNYQSSKSVTFKIVAANISSATASTVANQTYTGKALTPKPTLTFNGTTLKEGTDYTLSYKNNTNVGTATVTATGKGNYTGTKSVTFKIAYADPYNMGDESYSFENYGDKDSPMGHCFGMSITSAGYHNKLLNISRIGGNDNTPLYGFKPTATVKNPICHYQAIQGSYSSKAIVAGGASYLRGYYDIASDWKQVVNYVKDHAYDDTGLLQIGFRKHDWGGHAVNFLRYEKVGSQDRIYVYDNNFPDRETYFYQDGSGNVLQAPSATFLGTIDCIALRDVRTYFKAASNYDATHAIYMLKSDAIANGYTYFDIEADAEYVMYEIPERVQQVVITPKKDNASFVYMGKEYSFGKMTDEGYGVLTLATQGETGGVSNEVFTIVNPVESVPMYRLYNPNSGEHFYTANLSEKNMLVGVGWRYEGIGWYAPKTSKTPVYRLYNKNAGDHHYTMSVAERDHLISVGWRYEGIGWYSDDAKGVPLYRQYNPNAKSGSHNYTTNKAENDWLVSLGWRAEGIGWYGVKR